MGVVGAREKLATLVTNAEAALASFGERAAMLKACARYIAARKS
jgi:hypothetical protein